MTSAKRVGGFFLPGPTKPCPPSDAHTDWVLYSVGSSPGGVATSVHSTRDNALYAAGSLWKHHRHIMHIEAPTGEIITREEIEALIAERFRAGDGAGLKAHSGSQAPCTNLR